METILVKISSPFSSIAVRKSPVLIFGSSDIGNLTIFGETKVVSNLSFIAPSIEMKFSFVPVTVYPPLSIELPNAIALVTGASISISEST